jgi:hypothetical protein
VIKGLGFNVKVYTFNKRLQNKDMVPHYYKEVESVLNIDKSTLNMVQNLIITYFVEGENDRKKVRLHNQSIKSGVRVLAR